MKKKNAYSILILFIGLILLLVNSCSKDDVVVDKASLPRLTTTEVTDITETTATSGGTISSDGDATVIARGVCWSKNENPTTNDSKTTDGTGIGSFSSKVTKLEDNSTYYVRAYATNSVGTNYGNTITLKTLKITTLPKLTTNAITKITQTTAVSGGNVNDDGGAVVTAQGVCWSTKQSPTTSDNKTTDGIDKNDFLSYLNTLNPGATYYVRAYATNSKGTAYGNELNFTTSKLSANEVYNSATGKVWMDRNLGATRVATSSTDAAAYGDLYQWGRAGDGHQKRSSGFTETRSSGDKPGHGNFIRTQGEPYDWRNPKNDNLWQGINGINNPCPTGYRLPTESEWKAEVKSWKGNDNAYGAFTSPLKLTLAGYRDDWSSSLKEVGSQGLYWSSTINSEFEHGKYMHNLTFDGSFALIPSNYRSFGCSVRCIKD